MRERHGIAAGVLVLIGWILAGAVSAAPLKRAEVSAAINTTALQAGAQGVLAVVTEVKPGFHAQSHTPTESFYIGFEVTAEQNPAVKFFDPVYPAGKVEKYPALGVLNVYAGRVIVYVPFVVNAAAPAGRVKLVGKVRMQICDDKVCYAPESPGFEVETKVVGAGEKVGANRPELFKDFDASIFAKVLAGSTTAPAAASRPAAKGTAIDFFGWRFDLGANAYVLAFGIAFLVGIIFNLMPCVLPVVPLKAIGFYEVSRHNRGKSLFLGVVFSLGILACFIGLAMLVLVFHSLTWGQQFSNPIFVWGITIILVLMALGMFGVFTVLLPTSVYSFAPSHETVTGNFLFGMLSAVLSTPCTAPMFPPLLIWASGQPKSIGVGLVIMVGVGMAFPYLLLSAFPELARKMPRTGPWSELIKQMMGFLLLGTAVYFAGGQLVHSRAFFWGVFAVAVAAGVFLMVRTVQLTRRPGLILVSLVIAGLLVGSTLWVTLRLTRGGGVEERELIAWRPYTDAAFEEARKGGKPVMVEFTANWCANCLALEATVFRDARAAEAVRKSGAVTFRADLTKGDAPGWEHLRKLNPAGGIPLTAIYPPGAGEPVQLSSIYSTQNLVDALAEASRGAVAEAR